MTFKIKHLLVDNVSETKSDIFPWDMLKSDIIFHWSQYARILKCLL